MQKIIKGDCLDILKNINNIDVIATSPPYNQNIEYSLYKDKLPRDQYLKWTEDVAVVVKNSLKDNGSIFLNIGSTNLDPWLSMDVANIYRKYFILQNNIIWTKTITVKDQSYGQFKPANSKRFTNNNWENIFHFTKNGDVEIDRLAVGVPYAFKDNIERFEKDQDLRCRGNVWFMPYESLIRVPETGKNNNNINMEWVTVTEAAELASVPVPIISMAANKNFLNNNGLKGKERKIDAQDLKRWIKERLEPKNMDHPAVFPVNLPKMCVKLHGIKDNMIVCDPFVGTGTTLVACEELGINGIGIDIDQKYIDIAKTRIKDIKIIDNM